MKRELKDMVVVITGASAGIGRALAEELSGRGAKLVLAARRLERLEQINTTLGGRHLCVQVDVGNEEECRRLIELARERFGRIDTLVCNAGYGLAVLVAEMSAEQMEDIFRTNLYGTVHCIRHGVAVMEKQELRDGLRGQVMIVSSAAGRRGLPFYGAYSATKAAQLSLAEALRVELKGRKIAVTSVHPIGTETDFFATARSISVFQIPPPGAAEFRQTPQKVARKMTAAIRRPRPEVWPFGPVRIALAIGSLIPGIVDRIMGRYRPVAPEARGPKSE